MIDNANQYYRSKPHETIIDIAYNSISFLKNICLVEEQSIPYKDNISKSIFLLKNILDIDEEHLQRINDNIFDNEVSVERYNRFITADGYCHEFEKPEIVKKLLAEINDTFNECQEDNWDGYGALPLKKEVYDAAKEALIDFTDYLHPLLCKKIDICPLPDSGIGFELRKNQNEIFTLSVIN
ncbi:MAG: hypothetical protein SVR94_11620, partial [Pseudomonadota bacterium]|nr:hypothetical protein [Pseudomonadota bacterium]